MTTPAVSINVSVSQPQPFEAVYGDGSVAVGFNPKVVFGQRRARPQSINTQPVNGEYVRSTNWFHVSHVIRQSGGTVIATRRVPSSSASVVNVYKYYDGSSWNSGVGVSIPSLPSWVRTATELRALEKLKSSKVNFGVAIAEARRTVDLLADTTIEIASQIRNYAKAQARLWQRMIRSRGAFVPSNWTKLQYGWNPLLSDVQGACDNLADTLRTEPLVTAHASRGWDDVEELWIPGSYGRYMRQKKTKIRGTSRLVYKVQNMDLAAFASLGLTNPLEIVWERLPYSFILDWLVPVGRYLSVLDADMGLQFLDGYWSTLTSVEWHTRGVVFNDSLTWSISGEAPQVEGFARYYGRSKYASTPVPGLYIKSPITFGHVANAFSLLASALHRR